MENMATAAVWNVSGSDSNYDIDYNYDNDLDDVFWADVAKREKSIQVISIVLYSLVFVLGVLGNGVVIWATGFQMKKTVNTVWYLNLAVADFLVTVFLPLRITKIALDGRWPFGSFMCKTDAVVLYTNLYTSIYVLVVISVDRCVCVVRPVWAQNHRTVRKASWVVLGVWLLALALSSPHFIYREPQTFQYDKDILYCENTFPAATGNHSTSELKELLRFRHDAAMIVTKFLAAFLLPFATIVSCYSVLVCRIRNNRSLAGRSRRPFKIVVTVITVFFLCWAPHHIVDLIYVATGDSSGTLQVFLPVAGGMALLNSCLNPLLYVFIGQDFKDVFRRSILKVLEKAFAEEKLPQTNASSDLSVTTQMVTSALFKDTGLKMSP